MRASLWDDEGGSGTAEFVLVGALLTALTLAVLQLGLALYVRNVALDAAVEGAHHAALADTRDEAGAERAGAIVDRVLGDGYVDAASVARTSHAGVPSVEVTLTTTLPLAGLLGVPRGMEVTAHAPLESLE